MESGRSSKRKSSVKSEPEEDLVVAEEPTVSYNSYSKVKLQLRISAKVKLYGEHTGKLYIWERSGAIVEVDAEDSVGLLDKRLGGKVCCGGNPDNNKLFVRLE